MVVFDEEEHKYTNQNKQQYISATTIIHEYSEPFEPIFMSHYCALKKLDKDFDSNKGRYFQKKKKPIGELLQIIPVYVDKDVLDLNARILALEWEENNRVSRVKGTRVHLEKENASLDKDKESFAGINYQMNQRIPFKFEDFNGVSYYDLLRDGYHSELLLWNHDLMVAGTADIVVIETDLSGNRWVSIGDFKTNKEIKLDSKYKMLYPLNKYADVNYNHYTLQLSLYAYLLELMGFKVKHLRLIWINGEGQEVPFVLNYKKQDVINMINDYNETKQYNGK